MRRLALGAALCAVLSSAEAAPPPDLAAIAAAPVHDLAMTEAGGDARWLLWSTGTGADQAVHLALYRRAKAAWSTAWPDAYGPRLRLMPEWRHGGQPVLAVTLQFGAAAEQLDLFGLDAKGQPVRLAEKLGAAVGWAAGTDGTPLVILYDAAAGALKPSCYSWKDELTAAVCP